MLFKRQLLTSVVTGLIIGLGVLGVQQLSLKLVMPASSPARVVAPDDIGLEAYSSGSPQYHNSKFISTTPALASNSLYTWNILADSDELQAFNAAMAEELSKYDPAFLRAVGLNRVYLVDDIVDASGRKALGFSETTGGNIYLNLIDEVRLGTAYGRSTIHHEIGHLLSVRALGATGLESPDWRRLNPDADIYSSAAGGSELFPRPGFVSAYAMSSVAEDMAEVFAFAMSDGYSQLLAEEVLSDDILAGKLKLLEEQVDAVNQVVPWQIGEPQTRVSHE